MSASSSRRAAVFRSPRPDFHTPASPAENTARSGEEAVRGPPVAIGPVAIPGYLDRPQSSLAKATTPTNQVFEFNHWSEPVRQGIARVLGERRHRLPPAASGSGRTPALLAATPAAHRRGRHPF
ncbi:MAG: ABC-type transport auxiliary lipoprotein family protein [Bilophila sp.]